MEAFYSLLEPGIFAVLGIHRQTKLLADSLHLLLEEVFPLAFLYLLVYLALNLLLYAQKLLFLLDEDDDLLHPFPYIKGLQDILLLLAVHVENRGHKIGNLAGLVYVDHIKAHLF